MIPGGRLRNLSLIGASLVVALGAAELGLRVLDPLEGGFDHRMHRIPHPSLGWQLEPGARYEYRIPEGTVEVAYNAAGWRDVHHPVAKPAGTYRVLVLGDSFMEAYSVDSEVSFARRLESLARAEGRSVEVLNLGVGGYGTLQSALAFEERGTAYSPDLVLLGFYVLNDVRDNSLELDRLSDSGRLTRPYLVSERDEWVVTEIDHEASERSYRAALSGADAKTAIERHSRLGRLIGTAVRRGGNAGPVASSSPLYELGVHLCREPVEVGRAWDTTRRILRRLHDAAQAGGAELVVFTVPGLEEVASTTAAREGLSEVCLEEAPGYARLASIAETEAIAFIDLLPSFRAAERNDGVDLFHESDRHWNAAGHELAARQVIGALARRAAGDRDRADLAADTARPNMP